MLLGSHDREIQPAVVKILVDSFDDSLESVLEIVRPPISTRVFSSATAHVYPRIQRPQPRPGQHIDAGDFVLGFGIRLHIDA